MTERPRAVTALMVAVSGLVGAAFALAQDQAAGADMIEGVGTSLIAFLVLRSAMQRLTRRS